MTPDVFVFGAWHTHLMRIHGQWAAHEINQDGLILHVPT